MANEGLKNLMFRQALQETSTVAKEALGTLRITDDGRKFRYAKNGAAALVGGNAVMAPAVVAHHINMAVVANVAAGKTSVTVTLGATAVTANQYAGGFLQINAGAGIGHQYKVASHPAHAGTGNLVVTLEEPVTLALASATSKASLIQNPYAAVVVTTGANVNVVGVAPYAVPASAFFWVQTGGLAAAEINGTPAVASNLFAAADGELDAGPDTTTGSPLAAGPKVGYLMVIGVDDEAKPVFLTLD